MLRSQGHLCYTGLSRDKDGIQACLKQKRSNPTLRRSSIYARRRPCHWRAMSCSSDMALAAVTDASLSSSFAAASCNALSVGRCRPLGSIAAGHRYSSPAPATCACTSSQSCWLAGQQPGQALARPGQLAAAIAAFRSGHASHITTTGTGEVLRIPMDPPIEECVVADAYSCFVVECRHRTSNRDTIRSIR